MPTKEIIIKRNIEIGVNNFISIDRKGDEFIAQSDIRGMKDYLTCACVKALSLQKQEIVEEIEKIGKKYPNDLIFSDMKQMLVHNSLMI